MTAAGTLAAAKCAKLPALRLADERDVREGGRWTPLQAAKNAILYVLATAALVVVTPLPAGFLRAAGRALGGLVYALAPGLRRTTHRNIERVMPGLSPLARRGLAQRVYRTLGGYLGETVALLARRPFEALPIERNSREVFDEALAEGRGVVFLSAHLGPWESVAGSIAQAGIDLTVIARETYDPRFMKILRALREELGVKAVLRNAPGAHVTIVRVLRRKGMLGIPIDLASRVPSIAVPFLGSPARTAVGPARIALRAKCPVVVGSAAPASRATEAGPTAPERLQITVTRIQTGDLAAGPAGEAELCRRINDELSRRILAMPHGWVWMHPRWA